MRPTPFGVVRAMRSFGLLPKPCPRDPLDDGVSGVAGKLVVEDRLMDFIVHHPTHHPGGARPC